jgi:hypothetical protein
MSTTIARTTITTSFIISLFYLNILKIVVILDQFD